MLSKRTEVSSYLLPFTKLESGVTVTFRHLKYGVSIKITPPAKYVHAFHRMVVLPRILMSQDFKCIPARNWVESYSDKYRDTEKESKKKKTTEMERQ